MVYSEFLGFNAAHRLTIYPGFQQHREHLLRSLADHVGEIQRVGNYKVRLPKFLPMRLSDVIFDFSQTIGGGQQTKSACYQGSLVIVTPYQVFRILCTWPGLRTYLSLDMAHRNKKKRKKRSQIWVNPNISKIVKGPRGNRGFDPSAEAYREAYLAKQNPTLDVANMFKYATASEEKKRRDTGITIPLDRPDKTKFPAKLGAEVTKRST